MPRILVIDDDPVIGHLLFSHFEEMGYVTHRATTGMDALGLAAVEMYDVVFLDVRLPDGSGLDIIGDLKESAGKPEVIIITGYGEPDGAALAINSGAWDYIEKPFKLKQVTLLLMRVLEHRERRARQGPQSSLKRDGLIGSSPKINSCLNQVFEASQVDASVLIVGETGTGKELFARAIHNNSRRSNASFMAVDCASLPETLAESVLFGHEKGAFTGAHTRRDGMFAQADGGTLFLDEIGELRPMMQAKLLRVLQERVYRPVGSARDLRSDFRLVAATNRDLDSMTESGHFRKDLLFRLRSFTLKLPPLRERPEDIKEICTYHAARLAKHYSIPEKRRVAEMEKLYENIFRAVNIALVNELALLCNKIDIDIWEVIKLAKTKPYGFLPFYPGPGMGGHCIPIDPFYLTWKAREYDFNTKFIELAGEINTRMPYEITQMIIDALSTVKKCINGAKVLILGVAYKKDIADYRESSSLKIFEILHSRGADVHYNDPLIHRVPTNGSFSESVSLQNLGDYDCVVIATDHSAYDYDKILEESKLIVDTRNALKIRDNPKVFTL